MERRYRVLKTIRHKSILFEYIVAFEGDTFTQNENGFNIGYYVCPHPYDNKLLEGWIEEGFIEEILPNEKPIISDTSESENPYGRKIYLAEAIHALTNHDVLIKDKYGYVWDYDKIDETFYTYDDNKDTIRITDKYTLKEILEFQFDVISKHKDGGKWIKVKSNSELCSCIVKGKTIKVQGFIYKPEDLKTNVLIDAIFDEIKRDGVWYLAE